MTLSPWAFAERLPEVVEVKHRPDGSSQRFSCRLLARTAGTAALLYVLQDPWRVGGLELEAGVATFAYYWTSRWYNVYHWVPREGGTLAYYVNVATPARLEGNRVEWTDLGVDVLVVPGHPPQVLDEEEMWNLPSRLREPARRSLLAVLRAWRRLAASTEARTRRLLVGLTAGAPAPPGSPGSEDGGP
jgi:hypothetical protein